MSMSTKDRVVVIVLFILAVVALIILCTKAAKAETPCEKWTGIHEGKKAPCTGLGGPEKWIRDGEKCTQAKLPKCKEKLDIEKKRREADRELYNTILRSETKRADTCCKLALQPKMPLPEPAWYETVEFKVTMGVVVSGVVMGIFVALLYETEAVKP